MRIIKELMEIWPNEVCDIYKSLFSCTFIDKKRKEKKKKRNINIDLAVFAKS